MAQVDARDQRPAGRPLEVLAAFLVLGCTSFGGPAAHLGYFQREFVERRRWLSPETYAELVGLAQSLPGPASSQVGFGIGMLRAGLGGALAAWVGFTLPSAVLMLAFAREQDRFGGVGGAGLLHGLQLVAVAVVAAAVVSMQRAMAPDWRRMLVAVTAAAICLGMGPGVSTVIAVGVSGLLGAIWLRSEAPAGEGTGVAGVSRRTGLFAAVVFAVLLVAALAAPTETVNTSSLAANFFKAGALVFGGGHVVLPMLDGLVVQRGWVSRPLFLAGYGAAQAVPGPLFTFAAFLGAAAGGNVVSGLVALLAIFAPGLLLMTAALPVWGRLPRGSPRSSCVAWSECGSCRDSGRSAMEACGSERYPVRLGRSRCRRGICGPDGVEGGAVDRGARSDNLDAQRSTSRGLPAGRAPAVDPAR